MDGNPFAAAPVAGAQNDNTATGNPFDPMSAAKAVPQLQQQQLPADQASGAYPPQGGQVLPNAVQNRTGGLVSDNPFGAGQGQQATPQQQQPMPATGHPEQQPGQVFGQQQHQQQNGQLYSPSPYGGFPPANNAALVVSAQQSSPYGLAAPPAPSQANPFGASTAPGAIVPAQQQTSPWGMNNSMGAAPATKSFDPFAPPPPTVAAAPPPPPPQPMVAQSPQQQQIVPAQPQPYASQEIVPAPPQVPHSSAQVAAPQSKMDTPQPSQPPPSPSAGQNLSRYDHETTPQPIPRDYGNVNRHDLQQNYNEGDTDNPRHLQAERDQKQAKLGRELQRTAAVLGASPLPNAELVRKKGFVLSRISFRTIVMKKWKQSFWVQYGPHTMLWFRSDSDFNDWLNNPYHNQAQRNFLIKLAVNFVHDLYKPSVRGYQVTQSRTKTYGSKMIRQFKLERWMDYGPTIAAAFGSYNPKEVDDLRQAIVECMRNTPLNHGIRATGAVRQQQQQQMPPDRDNDESDSARSEHQVQQQNNRPGANTLESAHYSSADGKLQPGSSDIEKEGRDSDLLGLDNWDDVSVQQHSVAPSVPMDLVPAPAAPPQQQGLYGAPNVYGQPQYGAPAPPQQPNPYGAPPPQQPPPQQQYGAPPPQQPPHPIYGAPPPNPYGAPPPQQQQQQSPYGVGPPQQDQFGSSQQNPFGGPSPQQTF